jgi:2-C-methyl-D-erythritol 2,4-cyclodiphosphate synthase
MDLRIGLGFDIHRLVEGRPLFLGGVEIPFMKGALGHSDGDVLIHALIDAILGACGWGDIGGWFPDTDPHHKGARSGDLLGRVRCRLSEERVELVNAQLIVLAEAPQLGPHREPIVRSVASLVGCPSDRINCCAKTFEGLGPIGRGEAIAAQAVVLVRTT